LRFFGKIVGFFVGYMFGPLGAILGLVLGHFYDTGSLQRWWQRFVLKTMVRSGQQGDVFFEEVFCLMGYVAKCDGRVSKQEVMAVEQAIKKMGLNKRLREKAIAYFNHGKLARFEAEHSLSRLVKRYSSQPSMLHIAYEMLESVAKADSPILTGAKKAVMQMIGGAFGMQQEFSFEDLFEQFRRAASSGRGYSGSQQGPGRTRSAGSTNPYQVLGVKRDASDSEIKKRYRQLMSRYHPDRMIAQKKSKEEIAKATERTQVIKEAYETICRMRGTA